MSWPEAFMMVGVMWAVMGAVAWVMVTLIKR